ncbi:MAG: BlaI/MecI/CopY family transcriptional regulator [Acidimicrobiales bacterium]
MGKRPDGQLEYDVLHVLWSADRPLSPAEVNERLDLGLAYTTVATILTRLHAKQLVDRSPVGRAFAYQALVDEIDFALRRIHEVLASTSDRQQVLARFVSRLTEDEADEVRALLAARSA